MRAVVVAKTQMGQNTCVGAVETDHGKLLRLIPRDGAEYHSWQEFDADIGSVVAVTGSKPKTLEPPHIEDFIVTRWERTGKRVPELPAWIRSRCKVWTAGRSSLFGGRLRFTAYGKGHVDRGKPLPSHSVGFWELPSALTRVRGGDGKIRYVLSGVLCVDLPYVGVEREDCPARLARGTLVRLSLSRWLLPRDPRFAEACWLQLSGFYLP